MKFQVYVYKDLATKAFSRPIFELDTVENYVDRMKRIFAVEEEKLHVKSRDLVLYHLGEYDDRTCQFDLLKDPTMLLRVEDVEWIGGRYNVDVSQSTTKETV